MIGWTDNRASHAEYVVTEAEKLTPKPPAVPWEVAGALYVAGATAWAAVRAVSLSEGDTVVVAGAAGGVGSIAVQLAKQAGATVIGLASEPNHGWLRDHGVIPVTYGDGVEDRIRAAAPNGKVDAFVDTVGGDYVQLALDLGVAPSRVDTVANFEAVEKFGVKGDGSMVGVERGRPGRTGRSHRGGRAGNPDLRHVPAGPGPGRLPAAGRRPPARQDRPHPR